MADCWLRQRSLLISLQLRGHKVREPSPSIQWRMYKKSALATIELVNSMSSCSAFFDIKQKTVSFIFKI
jgi:hypothetical protein